MVYFGKLCVGGGGEGHCRHFGEDNEQLENNRCDMCSFLAPQKSIVSWISDKAERQRIQQKLNSHPQVH